jgi:hypothetical protein
MPDLKRGDGILVGVRVLLAPQCKEPALQHLDRHAARDAQASTPLVGDRVAYRSFAGGASVAVTQKDERMASELLRPKDETGDCLRFSVAARVGLQLANIPSRPSLPLPASRSGAPSP